MDRCIESPEDFFNLIVTPDFEDYLNDPKNIRMAFHVCMALDHLVDWIALSKAPAETRKNFIEKKYSQCFPHLEIIHNVSVNAKHFNPHTVSKINFGITQNGMSIDDWGMTDDVPDWDTYGVGPQVMAKEQEKGPLWLLNSITAVYSFWTNRDNWN